MTATGGRGWFEARRLGAAVVTTSTGLLVLWGLTRLLPDLIDGALAGCGIGAFLGTLWSWDPRKHRWSAHLFPAVRLVAITLGFMALSQSIVGNFDRPVLWLLEVHSVFLGLLLYGSILIFWWLVPCVTTTLWAYTRLTAPRDANNPPA